MKTPVVTVPSLRRLIQPSPGFAKKELATFHLELCALCGFGCSYCSSNDGFLLRTRRDEFLDLTEQQLGRSVLPAEDPSLMFVYDDVIGQLDKELSAHRPGWGSGKTIVVSMLTDAFSPLLVKEGVTRKALDLLLEKTAFRIRILTKSAAVGHPDWVPYFAAHRDRFVVGLSIGTLDDDWARRIEVGTSLPSARLQALHRLQDAGVATFGMLCPVFPDVVLGGRVADLISAVRPERLETLWAEPYNDRQNWRCVRDAYPADSPTRRWFDTVYAGRNLYLWSLYATDLYIDLRRIAESGGWLDQLKYLLYEANVTREDVARLGDLAGILFQSKPDAGGLSRNDAVMLVQLGHCP